MIKLFMDSGVRIQMLHKFSNRYANMKLISLKYNYRNSKAIGHSKINYKKYKKDIIRSSFHKISERHPIVKVEDFEMEAKSCKQIKF